MYLKRPSNLFSLFLLAYIVILSSIPSSVGSAETLMVSMRIFDVPERVACRLPSGYSTVDSQDQSNGTQCPVLRYKQIQDRHAEAETEKSLHDLSPHDLSVILDGNLYSTLQNYREDMLDKARRDPDNPLLPLKDRKAIIIVFDWGRNPRPELFITLDREQKGQNCSGNPFNRRRERVYEYVLPGRNQHSIYHAPADFFIPCSSVTWTLTASETASNGQTYKPWKFRMTAPD